MSVDKKILRIQLVSVAEFTIFSYFLMLYTRNTLIHHITQLHRILTLWSQILVDSFLHLPSFNFHKDKGQ